MLPISDITTFSFQEYPGHTSCIIWFGGCNFRCPYCHNPEFIKTGFPVMDEDKVFDFLNSRIGLLEGVVLSGGECTLSDTLYDFVVKIKKMGFKIKIDTNGTNFDLMKKLIDDELLDFVAMDYKAPKKKFKSIAGIDKFDEFSKTLQLVVKSGLPMEVRTTIHTDFLDENDVNEIILDLENMGYTGKYFIQNFENLKGETLGNVGEQSRILDKSKIDFAGLRIEFRN